LKKIPLVNKQEQKNYSGGLLALNILHEDAYSIHPGLNVLCTTKKGKALDDSKSKF